MNWLELHIDTTHTGLDPVAALLSTLEIDNLVIDDEEEFQDFLEETRPHWDYVDEDLASRMRGRSRITFYLLAGDAGFAKLAEVRMALQTLKESRSDCGSLLLTLENIQDADWENSWKQYYKPLEIGERLHRAGHRHPGPRPDLRHREPRHHPPLPHRPGEGRPRGRAGAGPGMRQRHPLHCGPAAGGGLRPGGGH